jgi:hypothetical protein
MLYLEPTTPGRAEMVPSPERSSSLEGTGFGLAWA